MSINISVKNVPDPLAKQLRQRARRHHRSLQGELMAILEESVAKETAMTPEALLQAVRESGLRTADESARLLRKERDGRSRR